MYKREILCLCAQPHFAEFTDYQHWINVIEQEDVGTSDYYECDQDCLPRLWNKSDNTIVNNFFSDSGTFFIT